MTLKRIVASTFESDISHIGMGPTSNGVIEFSPWSGNIDWEGEVISFVNTEYYDVININGRIYKK
jgi:hypothetical protein